MTPRDLHRSNSDLALKLARRLSAGEGNVLHDDRGRSRWQPDSQPWLQEPGRAAVDLVMDGRRARVVASVSDG